MDIDRAKELLSRFSQARVLVVGDIYLDENVFGAVTGISLEAPIPVFEVHERRYNPGAAGNAACNVAALGAKTYMCGYVGHDGNAAIVLEAFAARNVDTSGVVRADALPTNTYGKLRAGTFNAPSQEVLRTDTPKPTWISGDLEDAILKEMTRLAPNVDAIAVVDQVCSVATPRVLEHAVRLAEEHGLLTVGDSRENAGAFQQFDILVPNDREAGLGTGIEVTDDASLRAAGQRLTGIARNALVTRGPKGVTVFAGDGTVTDVPCPPLDPVDVTGAGDTVTATVTVGSVAGASLAEAAALGNAAAAVAVMQKGVVTVSKDELETALQQQGGPTKLKSLPELLRIREALRAEGKSVVWTNGCFDILHAGHIAYLLRAASLGDVLIVGLNSDASVRAVKGPKRPIIPERNRALILSALECVDYLYVFPDPSPLSVIEQLAPDVYAKGGDYTVDTVNQEERRTVEQQGGRVAILPGVEGQSTSAIIDRILAEQARGEA